MRNNLWLIVLGRNEIPSWISQTGFYFFLLSWNDTLYAAWNNFKAGCTHTKNRDEIQRFFLPSKQNNQKADYQMSLRDYPVSFIRRRGVDALWQSGVRYPINLLKQDIETRIIGPNLSIFISKGWIFKCLRVYSELLFSCLGCINCG